MNIVWRNVAEIRCVNLRGNLHVALHARFCHDVGDLLGDFKYATAILDSDFLHGGCDCQADGGVRSLGVGDNEVGLKRIKPAGDALHRCVKAFQVYAEIGVFLRLTFPHMPLLKYEQVFL